MAGRVTKYTAAALLGKYYMFIGEKAKAKTEFWKVIDSHRYELMENYGDNFNGLHENNKESILEVQFTGSLEGGHYEYNLFTLHLGPDSGCGAYEEAYPSKWLFNTLKKDLTEDGNTATDCMRLSFSTIPNPVRSITKTAKDSVITTKKTISTGANM